MAACDKCQEGNETGKVLWVSQEASGAGVGALDWNPEGIEESARAERVHAKVLVGVGGGRAEPLGGRWGTGCSRVGEVGGQGPASGEPAAGTHHRYTASPAKACGPRCHPKPVTAGWTV